MGELPLNRFMTSSGRWLWWSWELNAEIASISCPENINCWWKYSLNSSLTLGRFGYITLLDTHALLCKPPPVHQCVVFRSTPFSFLYWRAYKQVELPRAGINYISPSSNYSSIYCEELTIITFCTPFTLAGRTTVTTVVCWNMFLNFSRAERLKMNITMASMLVVRLQIKMVKKLAMY